MSEFSHSPVESNQPKISPPPALQTYDLTAPWKAAMPAAQSAAATKHFPTALPGHFIEQMAYEKLTSLGFTEENTVFSFSSCPDELNHDSNKEDITNRMKQRWGEAFPMGGLAGIPFTGKTGWGAFSHHIPEQGNILAMYGPHVGLTETGRVGSVHRPGMEKPTTACGASIGAYGALGGEKESRDPILQALKKAAKTEEKEEILEVVEVDPSRGLESNSTSEAGEKHDQQLHYIVD